MPSNPGKAGRLKWDPRVPCRTKRKQGIPVLLGWMCGGRWEFPMESPSAVSFLSDSSLVQTLYRWIQELLNQGDISRADVRIGLILTSRVPSLGL